MNIITMLEKFTSDFNMNFCTKINVLELEENFRDFTNEETRNLFKCYLEYMDDCFMKSEFRKENYKYKDTRYRKNIVTILGIISDLRFRRYINKKTGETYIFVRNFLNLTPYKRITDNAEKELLKCSVNTNSSYAAKSTIRDCEVSRATVAKISRNIKGSIAFDNTKYKKQPFILYIEMDEVHANLQDGTNRICPCAIVHEGHKETFTKRKALKNAYYFATAKGTYTDLWNEIYAYVTTKYDIDKFKALFVSGDGATGIKAYDEVFPQAIYVLDNYHYNYKYLNYIFKNDKRLSNLADTYLREDKIDDFELLIQAQIEKYPEQEIEIIKKKNYILNNINGIKNQHHKLYTCPCSMEGHVSQIYARYITSSPYGWSLNGLENKLKLLTLKANQIEITLKNYLNLKYGDDDYKKIIENVTELQNKDINLQNLNLNIKSSKKLNDIDVTLPIFDDPSMQDYFNRCISERSDIRFN